MAALDGVTGSRADLRSVADDLRAEETLKGYALKLESAMAAAKMAWWEMDVPSGSVTFDKRMAEMLGYPPAQFNHYKDFVDLVHPDDTGATMDAMRGYFEGRYEKYECEYRILAKSGEYRWFRDIGEIVAKDAQGKPLKVLGIALDVTSLKRTAMVKDVRLRLLESAPSLTLTELLRSTLDECEAVTGSTIGFFHFVEPDQITLSLQAWSTNTTERMCNARGSGSHYSIDQAGVWVDCVRERKPVIHNDYSALPHRKGMPDGHAPVIRELLIPVMRQGAVVAVLGLGNKPLNYDTDDIETVAMLADLVWDIVEVKRREDMLKRNEAILQSTQHIAHIGGWEWHVEKQEMFWTEETYSLHDLGPGSLPSVGEDAIAKSLECYEPEDRPAVFAAFERCVEEGVPYDLECRFTTYTGRLLWIRTFAQPIIENGKITRVIGVIMDITERKLAEVNIRQANAYHRSLLEASIDPLVMIGSDGRITDVNRATEIVTGVSRDELVGSDFSDYFTDPERARAGYLQVFHDGIVQDYPLEVQHRDGHLTPVLYNASLYRDAFGNVAGVFAAARDVTERNRAEELVRNMQRRESIGLLSGGIAHDYNNLLGIMMGNASIAQSQLPMNHPAAKSIEKALTAMDRAAKLTKQILDYSGHGKFQTLTIDIADMVRDRVNLFTLSLPKNVKLSVDLPGNSVYVVGDPRQIEQIFMNLLMNGGEAIGEKQGVVSIGVSSRIMSGEELIPYSVLTDVSLKSGEYALIRVTDDGVGMSRDIIGRVFDPFFSTKFQGRGLGLSAVFGIVQGHKGGITVESEVGKGTTICVLLPASSPP